MIGVGFAGDFTEGHLGGGADTEPYAQAFEPFADARAQATKPPCMQAMRVAEQSSSGAFGIALVSYAFDCGSSRTAAMTADGRLAQSFDVVSDRRGAVGATAPSALVYKQLFGRPFEMLGLPLPVVASPVEADLLDEASWGSEAVKSASVTSEVFTLSPVGVVSSASTDTLPVAEKLDAPGDLAIATDAPEDKPTRSIAVPAAGIQPGDAVTSVGATSRSAVGKSVKIAAAPRRRAVKTVSVSRTSRLPRAQGYVVVKPRAARRPPDVAPPNEPVVASRPRARSFSPKMSSAGPAQTVPKI